MPYRRLPNTNQARLRSLEVVVAKGAAVHDLSELPFSMKNLEDSRAALVKYSRMVAEYKQCFDAQVKNNKIYMQKVKVARMYVSHFIQVVNMCVLRNEIKKELKELYGLEPDNPVVPDLSTDEKLIEWGNKVIEGEQKRQMKGGTPIYNPSIGKVKVFFEDYCEVERSQRVFQANTQRKMNEVIEYNKTVDALILSLWDEIEASFAGMDGEARIEKCREYGVIYYYRRPEKRLMEKKAIEAEEEEEMVTE